MSGWRVVANRGSVRGKATPAAGTVAVVAAAVAAAALWQEQMMKNREINDGRMKLRGDEEEDGAFSQRHL